MKQVVIENPVLNSPFEAPQRHFRFDDEGITNEVVDGRRISSYFIPIAKPKKRGKRLQFDTECTQDRVKPNDWINQLRARVDQWREGKHVGVTRTTRLLLDYWRTPEREKKLFFCQTDRAASELETIVKEAPNFTEAHVSLATALYREKRKADGDRERAIVARLMAEKQASEKDAKAAQ